MSKQRHLQKEIDTTLKKVQEGVEVFDDLWQKMLRSEPDKKDKMESDLKKELKKLQKLRDQIRGWASSGDVKDTEALLAARRSIEVNMERFKAFERESKTKAFSKEGLARTGRRFNDDPEEQAKAQAREILNEYIDRLQVQMDEFEAEIETLSSGKKSQIKKSAARVSNLHDFLRSHKMYMTKLELIIRLIDRNEANLQMVQDLKDMMDYYLDENQDDDFMGWDDDSIFEEFPFEKLENDVVSHGPGKSKDAADSEVPLPPNREVKDSSDPMSTHTREDHLKEPSPSKREVISAVDPSNLPRKIDAAETQLQGTSNISSQAPSQASNQQPVPQSATISKGRTVISATSTSGPNKSNGPASNWSQQQQPAPATHAQPPLPPDQHRLHSYMGPSAPVPPGSISSACAS